MELSVEAPSGRTAIWDHFLLKSAEVSVRWGSGHVASWQGLTRVGSAFRFAIPNEATWLELTIGARVAYNGHAYVVLAIVQHFDVTRAGGFPTGLVPTRWFKGPPDQKTGFAKASPPLHPLLVQTGARVVAAIEFVDITELFDAIHGDTPWFKALAFLAGTARTIRVLGALGGHPLVWYAVVPASVRGAERIQPNVLYYPADYGGIDYVADSIKGLTTPNHNTSVGKVQCGGEILFSFLTKPITDQEYDNKIDAYVAAMDHYKGRPGHNPPALHHFRETMTYDPADGTLFPNHWDVPFGFETAIERHKHVLLVPQIAGGEAGIARRAGLAAVVRSAIQTIYAGGNLLTNETISIGQLVLTCYSQSGGNVFTAARANQSDIRGIICFEPQYMNRYVDGEDKNLSLGKDVIPLLIRDGRKVILVGRRRDGWESKYLPDLVDPGMLVLLPDDAAYDLLRYPDTATPYDPARSPVLARRYARLIKSNLDKVIDFILGDPSNKDFGSVQVEAKVESMIAALRKAGASDEALVKSVFTPLYNIDNPNGFYFTHNFIIASGQPDATGATERFFDLALGRL